MSKIKFKFNLKFNLPSRFRIFNKISILFFFFKQIHHADLYKNYQREISTHNSSNGSQTQIQSTVERIGAPTKSSNECESLENYKRILFKKYFEMLEKNKDQILVRCRSCQKTLRDDIAKCPNVRAHLRVCPEILKGKIFIFCHFVPRPSHGVPPQVPPHVRLVLPHVRVHSKLITLVIHFTNRIVIPKCTRCTKKTKNSKSDWRKR